MALAGSALGIFAILKGDVTGAEIAIVLSGGLFGSGLVFTFFVFPSVKIQTLATASTVYYALYLCAGMIAAIAGSEHHDNLFIYMVWFFPLLVFNKIVNSPSASRFLSRFLVAAPTVILAVFFSTMLSLFPQPLLLLLASGCLSYSCFGLMLNAVTRYREASIIERERAEPMRIESEVLESISDCFISLDSEFKFVYLNDAACSEFGLGRKAALHRDIAQAVPGFFSPSMLVELRAASGLTSASLFEAQNGKQDEWYQMRCYPRFDGISVHFRNITESVLAQRELEAANSRMREQSELLDQAKDAIFVHDLNSRFVYWNKGAERLFGWSAIEVVGRPMVDVFLESKEYLHRALSSVLQLGEWNCEIRKRDKHGRSLIVESRSTVLLDGDGTPRSIMTINTDITERKEAEAKVYQHAYYDFLTGLPNRLLFRERLEQTLAAPAFQGNTGALLLIDLDDFKALNDTCGHDVGDLLLKEVGKRLTSCVRKTDIVARFGGDEFVVMLQGLNADLERAAIEASVVAQAILESCRKPYLLGSYEYEGTTSIGITRFQEAQEDADELLKQVDLAMYRSKAQGRNTICHFDPAMERFAASRAALLADLRRALQNREFDLYYQPQLDSSGRVTGCEALLRWRHALRGMVSPAEFIPLAEAAGLIGELGQWVLDTACRQLATWARQSKLEDLTIAINVSIRQFLDGRFVQLVEDAIRESGTNPQRLKLEITESFMMEKTNEIVAKMHVLKGHGIGFSLDDFGTGFSSLSQLKRLPLDQLKIDQSFVRDVLNGVKDASIVRTIIALGKTMNLNVIAEGVETEEQRKFLEDLGCYAYQGYLFSPALSAPMFEAFVEERRPLKDNLFLGKQISCLPANRAKILN
jgi:diguanylate cyclase (GGDEF)-like protein/PAS domain S-box-containing protein